MATNDLRGIHASVSMLRADVDVREFHRWAGSRQLVRRDVFDEGYAMHCLLTEMFGQLAPKPFRLIVPNRGRSARGVLYGYVRDPVDDLREAASQFACPLQLRALPASSLDTKFMPKSFREGSRLGFEVLIRPIVRPARGGKYAGQERDAFQQEAEAHTRGGMNRTREEVYREWLRLQIESRHAGTLEGARLISFQRQRAVRSLRGPTVEGPHALMRGVLSPRADSSEFHSLIDRGIGRHRSYGYGMLLLRPAPPKSDRR